MNWGLYPTNIRRVCEFQNNHFVSLLEAFCLGDQITYIIYWHVKFISCSLLFYYIFYSLLWKWDESEREVSWEWKGSELRVKGKWVESKREVSWEWKGMRWEWKGSELRVKGKWVESEREWDESEREWDENEREVR